jgi:hypothetical protein
MVERKYKEKKQMKIYIAGKITGHPGGPVKTGIKSS